VSDKGPLGLLFMHVIHWYTYIYIKTKQSVVYKNKVTVTLTFQSMVKILLSYSTCFSGE